MRTDAEREQRAIWKLEQGLYAVHRESTGYLVFATDGSQTTIDDLAALVELAEAVYERLWTGRPLTPSA